MSIKSTNDCCPKLSVALRVAKDDEGGPKVTRDTIADALLISPTQAGRVLAGKLDDDLANLNNALRGELRLVFASVLLCGTGFSMIPVDADPDVNADGVVDKRDVFGGGVQSLQHVTRQLQLAQDNAAGGSYTPHRVGEMKASLLKAIQVCGRVMAALDALTLTGPVAARKRGA